MSGKTGLRVRLLCRSEALRRRDPAAAHRLVEVDERSEHRALRLDESELDVEQAALGVEHFDVAREPALVAQARKPRVTPQRIDLAALRDELLANLLVRDERVFHFAE